MTGHEDALVFAYIFPAFGMPDTSPHFSRVKDYTLGRKNAIWCPKNPRKGVFPLPDAYPRRAREIRGARSGQFG